ncbi:helix-turn-helix domain-containing protein [Streptomyces sp. NBC_00285]|uniref:helix-turn-helix transcriptional regulator n=1 Tax=Streptomyces sp. NBC_00285 TaxID=2975700 RepID=UPI002E2A3F3B|nr:helix-turn-helix transcriptional regulator [Streptomyces sp. NBC_00285]
MAATTAEKIRSRLQVRRALPAPEQRRAIREAAGLTQKELADAVGVSRQAVTQWETGARSVPRGKLLDRYVEALETLKAETAEVAAKAA